jgi:hypothetical protein
MSYSNARFVRLLLGITILAACNSGGGAAQDFEVLGLQVGTENPQLGHEMVVQVELLATRQGPGASLVFMVADRAEVDAGAAEPTLQVVDGKTIEPVLAGDNLYELALDLPADDLAPGDYYLIAVVDPLNAMKETDETDNGVASDEIRRRGVPVTIGAQAESIADIVVESMDVDDPVADVEVTPDPAAPVGTTPDVPNSDFGITAVVRSSGPDTVSDVPLIVQLEIPGVGLFATQLWDSAAGAYADSITIPSLASEEPCSIHLDVLVPQAARDILATLLPAAVQQTGTGGDLILGSKLHVYVDPLDQIPEFEDGIVLLDDNDDENDNHQVAPVFLRVFSEEEGDIQTQVAGTTPPANEINWEVPFVKDFSNSNIGIGVHFGANAKVGTKGVYGEGLASVPLTLVGHTIDLLALEAKGLFNPLHKADNGFGVTLKALTVTLYEKRTKEDEQLNPGSPLTYTQEYSTSANFAVGPVPMFVKIGARGSVGININASVGYEFRISADPFLNFSVFAEGGPGGSFAGWTLGGGVGASMTLIDDTFHAGIVAGTSYDSGTSILTGSVMEEVTNDLKGPKGKVYLFVTATGKVLWKEISKRWEYVLATWSSFELKDTIFNRTQSVSVEIP